MSDRMVMRRATEEDIPQIVLLWLEGMAVHATIDPRFPLVRDAQQRFGAYLIGVLADPKALVLVCEEDRNLVAYCLSRVTTHPTVFANCAYGYINDLFVTSARRRNGIGTTLFDAMSSALRRRGVASLEVSVVPGNDMAATFWRKQGFKPRVETLRLDYSAT